MYNSINQGFITEANHFEALKISFGDDRVSEPKNSGGGSDFIVITDEVGVVTFESKSANTDVFDAGVINMFSNGMIFHVSSFLSNTHVAQVEQSIRDNFFQVADYTKAANTNVIPHSIETELYNSIKAEGKLIHIIEKKPLHNIIEESFIHGKNKFVKANYVIIDQSVYCISDRPELDPLNLREQGAHVLNDEDIDTYSLRTARGGSRNGKASVTVRLQYRLKRKLPPSRIKLI